MHNLPLLLLDCLVVLMMIGSQSVSAQALGAVYSRGSGSINPQAISPNRALNIVTTPISVGEDVAGYYGTVAGIVAGCVVFVVICCIQCRKCLKDSPAGEALKV